MKKGIGIILLNENPLPPWSQKAVRDYQVTKDGVEIAIFSTKSDDAETVLAQASSAVKEQAWIMNLKSVVK